VNAAQEGKGEDEHRHRCLVRWVIKTRIQDRDAAVRFLDGYRDITGKTVKGWNQIHPKSNLDRDVKEQWIRGNRGNEGEWK
jgi:hypothetical protein